MENSSSQNDGNKSSSKGNSNIIAWRMRPSLIPMFQDLANQAYEAHLIREPKLTSQVFIVILCRDVAAAEGCPEAVCKAADWHPEGASQDVNGNL